MGWTVVLAVLATAVVINSLFTLIVLKVALPIFEAKPPFGAERFPPAPGAELLSIPTTQGLRLQASLIRSQRKRPRGLIVFCPELDSNRWSASAYCEGLLDAGFDVLTFDFRNQGDSDEMPGYEPMHWLSTFEVDDVLSVISYVESRADLRSLPLGIYGMSRGGGAALMAAAQCERIQAVATDGAYSSFEMLLYYTGRWGQLYFPRWLLRLLPRWHVNMTINTIQAVSALRNGRVYARIERALSKLRHKPLLMISGERDTYVIPAITINLHACSRQDASGVCIVQNAKHNMSRQADPHEYDRRLVEFFSGLDSGATDRRMKKFGDGYLESARNPQSP